MGKHFNIGDWVRLHRKFGLPKEKPWIVIQYQQLASVYCVRKGDGMLYLYSQTQLELAELPHDKHQGDLHGWQSPRVAHPDDQVWQGH
jgi:hypothetical protein